MPCVPSATTSREPLLSALKRTPLQATNAGLEWSVRILGVSGGRSRAGVALPVAGSVVKHCEQVGVVFGTAGRAVADRPDARLGGLEPAPGACVSASARLQLVAASSTWDCPWRASCRVVEVQAERARDLPPSPALRRRCSRRIGSRGASRPAWRRCGTASALVRANVPDVTAGRRGLSDAPRLRSRIWPGEMPPLCRRTLERLPHELIVSPTRRLLAELVVGAGQAADERGSGRLRPGCHARLRALGWRSRCTVHLFTFTKFRRSRLLRKRCQLAR